MNNYLLEKLEEKLKGLPSWKEQKIREDSWITSDEIADWFVKQQYGEFTESQIEDFLVNQWENDKLRNIRPAKYPHSKNFRTLWGHIDKVYPLEKNKIQLRKINPKMYSSQKQLSSDAPIIFLSHSLFDFDYAKQVSKKINETHKCRTWLCEEDLDVNSFINQEIRDSISQCDALVVLLTYNSLGSAYVHTEIQIAVEKLIPVIKSNDKDIMEVLDAYEKDPVKPDLDSLLSKYKQTEQDKHRIERYEKNAKNILNIIQGNQSIVLYPDVPLGGTKNKFINLGKALDFSNR